MGVAKAQSLWLFMICDLKAGSRLLLSLLLAIGVSVAASGLPGFVEKSILVTVLDKDGAPIRDLAAADFTVLEDGKRREVTGAELSTDLLFVSVMVDTTKPPDGDVDRIRDLRTSLATFVKTVHAVSPTTEIALTTVGGAGVLVRDFTTQTAELEQITSRVVPELAQGAVVLEALAGAARGLMEKPSPRRAIVVIDFASREDSAIQAEMAALEVFKSGASVWSVSVQGSMRRTGRGRDAALDDVTKKTGGVRTTVLVPSALESILKNVAASLTAQYVVTYTRPDGATPRSIVPSAKRGSKFLMSPVIQ